MDDAGDGATLSAQMYGTYFIKYEVVLHEAPEKKYIAHMGTGAACKSETRRGHEQASDEKGRFHKGFLMRKFMWSCLLVLGMISQTFAGGAWNHPFIFVHSVTSSGADVTALQKMDPAGNQITFFSDGRGSINTACYYSQIDFSAGVCIRGDSSGWSLGIVRTYTYQERDSLDFMDSVRFDSILPQELRFLQEAGVLSVSDDWIGHVLAVMKAGAIREYGSAADIEGLQYSEETDAAEAIVGGGCLAVLENLPPQKRISAVTTTRSRQQKTDEAIHVQALGKHRYQIIGVIPELQHFFVYNMHGKSLHYQLHGDEIHVQGGGFGILRVQSATRQDQIIRLPR